MACCSDMDYDIYPTGLRLPRPYAGTGSEPPHQRLGLFIRGHSRIVSIVPFELRNTAAAGVFRCNPIQSAILRGQIYQIFCN